MKLSWMPFLLLAFCMPLQTHADDALGGIVNRTADKVFSEIERRTIRDYYNDKRTRHAGNRSGMPPGLTGRELPPGLQMQLQRNGRLPPGLEKKALPYDLVDRLPPVPRGYERVIVDSHVVLVETASQIIADTIIDVVYQ